MKPEIDSRIAKTLNSPRKEWTIIDIINWGTDYFKSKGIEAPGLNIELLLCDVLNLSRIQLYTNFDKPLQNDELKILRDYVIRRGKREPLQHITGYAEFRDFKLKVNHSTLIPRPETEYLIELIADTIGDKSAAFDILDIGTGSGCIAIALASILPKALIRAIDIDSEAITLAKENAAMYGIGNIEFSISDILREEPTGQFDIIVSNPPYMTIDDYECSEAELRIYERMDSLTDGKDGLTFFRCFSQIFPKCLKPGGKFFLEVGYGQSEDLKSIFNDNRYEIRFLEDFSGITRYIVGLTKH